MPAIFIPTPPGGVTTSLRGVTTFPSPPSVAARPAWLPAIYELTTEVSTPPPDARPSWLPAIYELNPEIPTRSSMPSAESMQVLCHPEADDPSSRLDTLYGIIRGGCPSRRLLRGVLLFMLLSANLFCMLVPNLLTTQSRLVLFSNSSMSAPIDHAFSTFYRDEAGKSLHGAATSAAIAFSVTITTDMGDLHVPKGYKHALISRQAEYWRIAIDKKLSGLIVLNTWSYVRACDLPAGSNIMNCH